jgi:mannan endo-1,4-beta-mannosidase
MKKACITLCIFGLAAFHTACSKIREPQPVNPYADPEAKYLLEFLYSIRGKYTLAGQHNFVSSPGRYDGKVYEITGKQPALWGSDFSFMVAPDSAQKVHHCGPMNLSDPMDSLYFIGKSAGELRQGMIDEAKRQYLKGKIITLMWHGCFPASGDSCMGDEIWAFERKPSAAAMDSLVTEGTYLNQAWKKQADGIAFYLKQLQDAHIPVLWRPYHEMNGIWFWWCDQKENQGFIKLWRMMFTYFTHHHKLNNLLWVWDANAPRKTDGDEAWPYEPFYPGNEYVDVVAADVYHSDYQASHHDELVALGKGKPLALGEIGQVPADSAWTRQNQWTWFMVWGYFIDHYNKPEEVKVLYDNPRIITLDELTRNPNGKYSIHIK